jgi:hypothetical protein
MTNKDTDKQRRICAHCTLSPFFFERTHVWLFNCVCTCALIMLSLCHTLHSVSHWPVLEYLIDPRKHRFRSCHGGCKFECKTGLDSAMGAASSNARQVLRERGGVRRQQTGWLQQISRHAELTQRVGPADQTLCCCCWLDRRGCSCSSVTVSGA